MHLSASGSQAIKREKWQKEKEILEIWKNNDEMDDSVVTPLVPQTSYLEPQTLIHKPSNQASAIFHIGYVMAMSHAKMLHEAEQQDRYSWKTTTTSTRLVKLCSSSSTQPNQTEVVWVSRGKSTK